MPAQPYRARQALTETANIGASGRGYEFNNLTKQAFADCDAERARGFDAHQLEDDIGVEDNHAPKSGGYRIASRETKGNLTPPSLRKRSLMAWPRSRGRAASVDNAERWISRASSSVDRPFTAARTLRRFLSALLMLQPFRKTCLRRFLKR